MGVKSLILRGYSSQVYHTGTAVRGYTHCGRDLSMGSTTGVPKPQTEVVYWPLKKEQKCVGCKEPESLPLGEGVPSIKEEFQHNSLPTSGPQTF